MEAGQGGAEDIEDRLARSVLRCAQGCVYGGGVPDPCFCAKVSRCSAHTYRLWEGAGQRAGLDAGKCPWGPGPERTFLQEHCLALACWSGCCRRHKWTQLEPWSQ